MTSNLTLVAAIDMYTVQPLTFTHHGTEGLPLLTRGIDAEGRHQRSVYIPAAQLRGRLRHEAALAELRGRPHKAKLEDAYLLALGQDLRPNEDEEPEAVRLKEQITFRQQNPLLDIFGTWKVASRLFVSHLLPAVNVLPDKVSHIRRDLDTNQDMMNLLDDAEHDRFYERQGKQGLASKAEGLIKLSMRELAAARKAKDTAKVDDINAKLEELKALKQTRKGEDTSDNTKHLLELQVIPAGITLSGKLTMMHAQAFDLQTLVTAFDGLIRKPFMGAQQARGCGEVKGQVRFSSADGEVLLVLDFGGLQAATLDWTQAGLDLVQTANMTTAA
jgi:CRISPR/Cas system CSM-associated protein Csm3 (group 7 of RAMP superfamily)